MSSIKAAVKILAPAYLGTVLEWYDFSIFAFFSPIMSERFFPADNPWASWISVYAVFAVGFLIRPLGAAVFGHYGDRIGRKRVLVLSMLAISLSTIAIGLLPTWQQIGLMAPVLLVICRLIQGFCVGGETTGAAAYVLESLPERSRGVLGSMMWSAVGTGMLLSSLVTSIMTQCMSPADLSAWAWRLPFLFGIVSGLLGYYFRRQLPEAALFTRIKNEGQLNEESTLQVIRHNKKSIGILTGLYALSAMITYLVFVFMPFYASNVMGIPMNTASLVTTVAIAVVTFTIPFAGMLSDRIGRKPCLCAGAVGFLIFAWPSYALLASKGSLASLITVEAIFVLLAFLYQGTLTTAAQELVQTPVRYTITAIGYNVSYAIFGGTAPFAVTWLTNLTQSQSIPGLYLMSGSILALIALSQMKETANTALE
ncbi:MFS transporter [Legionella sp. CNM-4043-24]|uniref:MFS transporter n=1 Tax=Legionella sp. CNM-4043-24 TaxID=3421646 RepID=UPI00403A91C9